MSCIPYVMISHSDDGGMTWSHERWMPLLTCHKNYLYRVVIRRGGWSLNRIYKLRYSENSSFTLVSAHADISVGV